MCTRVTALIGSGVTVEIGGFTSDFITGEVRNIEQSYSDDQGECRSRSFMNEIASVIEHPDGSAANFEEIYNALELLFSAHLAEVRQGGKRPAWLEIAEIRPLYSDISSQLLLTARQDLLDCVANRVDGYARNFLRDFGDGAFRRFWREATEVCPWDIAVLNYDDCIEKSIENAYVDGFVSPCVNNQENSTALCFQPSNVLNPGNKSRVLHLHGSIFYGMGDIDQNQGIGLYQSLYKYPSFEEAHCRWYCHSDISTDSGEELFSDAIITGLRKQDKILMDPFGCYRYLFEHSVYFNTRLFIAGYSFGDSYINEILSRMRVLHGEERRIVVVIYATDECRQRYFCSNFFAVENMSHDARMVVSALANDYLANMNNCNRNGMLPERVESEDSCVRIYFGRFGHIVHEYGREIIEFLTE